MKARHPAEFLAAVLRNQGGFYAPRAYVEEARRLGVTVALPCIHRSEVGPTGCRGVLRLGLGQVKGLREGTAEGLVARRASGGPFLSLSDLLLRTPLERAEAERLVLCGALDGFDRPRPETLWQLALDFERCVELRGDDARPAGIAATGRLFAREAFLKPRRSIPVPPSYPPARLLELEMETLGLTATAHPMELVQEAARAHGAVPTSELSRHVGRAVRLVGFLLTDRRVRTKKGRYMKFLMVEDLHGTAEVTLFPEAYQRVGARLSGSGPFLVTGVVRSDHGALTVDAQDVEVLATET